MTFDSVDDGTIDFDEFISLGRESRFWRRMGKSMQPADFFTNMSLMVSCNTPEFFNARLEGQHAQN